MALAIRITLLTANTTSTLSKMLLPIPKCPIHLNALILTPLLLNTLPTSPPGELL